MWHIACFEKVRSTSNHSLDAAMPVADWVGISFDQIRVDLDSRSACNDKPRRSASYSRSLRGSKTSVHVFSAQPCMLYGGKDSTQVGRLPLRLSVAGI